MNKTAAVIAVPPAASPPLHATTLPTRPANEDGEYLARLQNNPVGLGIMIGGSSARMIALPLGIESDPRLVTGENLLQWKWADYKNDKGLKDKAPWPSADQFVADFAKKCFDFLVSKGISPSRVVRIQGSIAGFVAEQGKDSPITTTNTPVRFDKYHFGQTFLRALKALDPAGAAFKDVASIPLINDGFAAMLGDILHPEGAARGITDGVSIIIGTGIGGGGTRNGKVVPARNEIGHILWFDSLNDEYIYVPLEQLKKEKIYKEGHYKDLPTRYSYFEHRLAGPWVAINFVKKISENGALVEALAKETGISASTLLKLEELKRSDQERWAMQANGNFILPVNKFILSRTYAEELFPLPVYPDVGTRGQDERKSLGLLIKAAVEYKKQVHIELGKALATLLQQQEFRGSTIVLVSGVAEAWYKAEKDNFLNPLYRACGLPPESGRIIVSSLDGASREACGVIDGAM